jgi:hypothetical protein
MTPHGRDGVRTCVPRLLIGGGGAGGTSTGVAVKPAAEFVVFLLGLVAVAAGVPGFLALGAVLPGLGALAAQAGQHHRDAEEPDRAGDGADDEELGRVVDAQRLPEQGRAAYRVVVFQIGSRPKTAATISRTKPMMITSTP